MADAFEADPLMVWLLPDPATRHESTRRWWRPIVAGYLAADRALVAGDGNACLLWRFAEEVIPDGPGQPPVREVVTQLVGTERLEEVGAALAVFRRLRPVAPHVYVHVVAARPGHQGRGLGAELIDELVCGAAGGQPLCLESTNPRNHPFYVRSGFSIGAHEVVPGSEVTATAFFRGGTPALGG